MKICVAQTKPVKGDIPANILAHEKLIALAVEEGAQMIIFPELSITGYEPALANELATHENDNKLNNFQNISDTKNIIIGVGMPLRSDDGVMIGMIIFQPHKSRQTYSKQYLHEDEFPFFVQAKPQSIFKVKNQKIALAICYELSVEEHERNVFNDDVELYIASVAKTSAGVEKAVERLSEIALKYSVPVLMSNCIGYCDNFKSAGHSSVWNNKGELLTQLNGTDEGLIMLDTATQQVIQKII